LTWLSHRSPNSSAGSGGRNPGIGKAHIWKEGKEEGRKGKRDRKNKMGREREKGTLLDLNINNYINNNDNHTQRSVAALL